MANIQKWVAGAGVGLTWTTAQGSTDVDSITNTTVKASTTIIDNSSALDLYADLSISLGSITSGAGTPYFAVYLQPLNQDGTTYGDGVASGTTAPAATYFVGTIMCPASATAVITGTLRGIVIPPGSFRFTFQNMTGATLAGSANVIKYRTYNLNNNG